MTADLGAGIAARLGEIEAVARAATGRGWTAGTTGPQNGDHWMVIAASTAVCWISANDGENEDQRPKDAAHIAARDPAWTLALVEGLRAVVSLHPAMTGRPHRRDDASWDRDPLVCETCIADTGETELWPCPTLLAVAMALGVEA